MASRLLQIPKQRELYIHLNLGNSQQNYSSAKLKSDSIGWNANLKKNSIGRIQKKKLQFL